MATYSLVGNDLLTEEDMPPIQVGASCPQIFARERDLYLAYCKPTPESRECLFALITFCHAVAHYFGPPDEETLEKHPLFDKGLQRWGSYRVSSSSWLAQLKSLTKDSKYHQDLYGQCQHFILTFHDTTFECVCRDYSVREGKGTPHEAIQLALDEVLAEKAEERARLGPECKECGNLLRTPKARYCVYCGAGRNKDAEQRD